METTEHQGEPFAIKDCALIAIATGEKAQNLRELREILRRIDPASVYYHFWGGLLRPRFDDPEYHNDFAIWVYRDLHDKPLAEQLAVLDPASYETIEDLRSETIDIVEDHLYRKETPTWAPRDRQFEFIRSQIVVFNTNLLVEVPEDLMNILPDLSVGSIFFHFIDGRRRNENGMDDFSFWLSSKGSRCRSLCQCIAQIDPYFSSLADLRGALARCFEKHLRDEQGHQGE